MTARTLPAKQSLSLPTFTVASEGTVLEGTFNLVSVTIDRSANRIPTARLMFKDGSASTEGYLDVCSVNDIEDHRARIVSLSGERVAVFRYDGKISAVSNVCQHQNGPLGEGKVIDGCITCPWHGYQYRPEDGASPPPFTEKIPTFRVRVDADRVLVHPQPLPPGTRVEPAVIGGSP